MRTQWTVDGGPSSLPRATALLLLLLRGSGLGARKTLGHRELQTQSVLLHCKGMLMSIAMVANGTCLATLDGRAGRGDDNGVVLLGGGASAEEVLAHGIVHAAGVHDEVNRHERVDAVLAPETDEGSVSLLRDVVVVLGGEGDFGATAKSSPPPALAHCHGRALTRRASETCWAC